MPADTRTMDELRAMEAEIQRSIATGNRRIGRMNWATARHAAYSVAITKLQTELAAIRAVIAEREKAPQKSPIASSR
jgi:hypothetical protein